MDTKESINNNLKNISTDNKEWILKNPKAMFSINDSLQPSKAKVIHTLNERRIKKITTLNKTEAIAKYGNIGAMAVMEIVVE